MTERPSAAVIARLFARLVIERPGGCWEWQGARDARGYGRIKADGKPQWVHRLSFVIFNGPIEEGEVIHHTCHNTSCVNPDHLESTTHSENSREGARHRWASEEIPI